MKYGSPPAHPARGSHGGPGVWGEQAHRMSISPGALSRRRLLATAAGLAATAPFLSRRAFAQAGAAPLRLVLWPCMNGAESRHFFPSNLSALSTVTEPLRPWSSMMTFIKGVDVSGSNNHYAVRSIFSGARIPNYTSADPSAKSADQVIADHFEASAPSPLKSLHLGVIPADSINYYQRAGRSTFFFAPKPVDYEANPVTAFDRIFGGDGAKGPVGVPDFMSSSLDILEAEMTEVGDRLQGSASELGKLQQHRAALQDLRPVAGGMKDPAASPMAEPIESVEKLRPLLEGKAKDAYKHQYFNDIFDAQVDIMARALTTGLTRVATLQAGSADGNAVVPVDRGYPHHNTSHGNQNIFSRLQQWYVSKMARLVKALDVPDPLDPTGKTVLYNTAIVYMAECLPVSHSSNDVPTFILGNAGGRLKTGMLLNANINNKVVMATIVNAFGAGTVPQFGSQLLSEVRG